MKILVPVKRVAFLDDEFELRDDGRDVDPDFCEYDLNEFDDYSLEEAVKIKEAAGEGGGVEIVAVTIGPDDADDVLRKCLAKGADRAIRVWDDALEGSDQIVVARVLAKLVEREKPDLVFTGAQSADMGYAQTGIALAGVLGWPHVAVVSYLEVAPGAASAKLRRELEGGLEHEMTVKLPAVLTIQLGINRPRYASLRGIRQAAGLPIEVLSHGDLGLGSAQVGEAGSLSRVRKMYVPEKGRAEIIKGTPAQQAARIVEIIKTARGL
jgi:electron transfer flavoprotein beta subunit